MAGTETSNVSVSEDDLREALWSFMLGDELSPTDCKDNEKEAFPAGPPLTLELPATDDRGKFSNARSNPLIVLDVDNFKELGDIRKLHLGHILDGSGTSLEQTHVLSAKQPPERAFSHEKDRRSLQSCTTTKVGKLAKSQKIAHTPSKKRRRSSQGFTDSPRRRIIHGSAEEKSLVDDRLSQHLQREVSSEKALETLRSTFGSISPTVSEREEYRNPFTPPSSLVRSIEEQDKPCSRDGGSLMAGIEEDPKARERNKIGKADGEKVGKADPARDTPKANSALKAGKNTDETRSSSTWERQSVSTRAAIVPPARDTERRINSSESEHCIDTSKQKQQDAMSNFVQQRIAFLLSTYSEASLSALFHHVDLVPPLNNNGEQQCREEDRYPSPEKEKTSRCAVVHYLTARFLSSHCSGQQWKLSPTVGDQLEMAIEDEKQTQDRRNSSRFSENPSLDARMSADPPESFVLNYSSDDIGETSESVGKEPALVQNEGRTMNKSFPRRRSLSLLTKSSCRLQAAFETVCDDFLPPINEHITGTDVFVRQILNAQSSAVNSLPLRASSLPMESSPAALFLERLSAPSAPSLLLPSTLSPCVFTNGLSSASSPASSTSRPKFNHSSTAQQQLSSRNHQSVASASLAKQEAPMAAELSNLACCSHTGNDDDDVQMQITDRVEEMFGNKRTEEHCEDEPRRKLGGRLRREEIDHLTSWFLTHLERPYPSAREREALAIETGLTIQQVRDWFINMRKRHWNPIKRGQRQPANYLEMLFYTKRGFSPSFQSRRRSGASPKADSSPLSSSSMLLQAEMQRKWTRNKKRGRSSCTNGAINSRKKSGSNES